MFAKLNDSVKYCGGDEVTVKLTRDILIQQHVHELTTHCSWFVHETIALQ